MDGEICTQDLHFRPGTASLEGSVTLKGAEPETVLQVELRYAGPEGMEFVRGATDAEGHFFLDAIPAGAAELALSTPGGYMKRVEVELEAHGSNTVAVELAGGVRIAGAVSGLAPSEQCMLVVLRGEVALDEEDPMGSLQRHFDSMVGRSMSGEDGSYELLGLSAGTHTVMAAGVTEAGLGDVPEFRTQVIVVEVDEDDDMALNIEFE